MNEPLGSEKTDTVEKEEEEARKDDPTISHLHFNRSRN